MIFFLYVVAFPSYFQYTSNNTSQLNTSRLGFDVLKNKLPKGGLIPNDTILPDFIDDWLNKGEDKVTEIANDVANEIADRVAEELGINEWYSLHVMDLCYGNYKPNATFVGAGKNGTNCTRDVGMSTLRPRFLMWKRKRCTDVPNRQL